MLKSIRVKYLVSAVYFQMSQIKNLCTVIEDIWKMLATDETRWPEESSTHCITFDFSVHLKNFKKKKVEGNAHGLERKTVYNTTENKKL